MVADNSPLAGKKHAGGRPLKYKSLADMQPLIDDYFATTPPRTQTITGLALALDTDRTTIINYENRDEFFDAIKRAKNRVEHAYELSLRERGGAGDIFGLKNFGWKDRVEQDLTTNGKDLPTPILGNMNVLSDNSNSQDTIPQ